MNIELIKLIVTVLSAIAGWLLAGWLNSRRDSANKRREIVVQHLIDAYKILTQEIGHRDPTVESITKFENLLSEIQLFGSKKQADLAQALANQTAYDGSSTIDPLIEDMRNELRKELDLEPVESNTIWFRFSKEFKQGISDKNNT
jgi:hypothetical protein